MQPAKAVVIVRQAGSAAGIMPALQATLDDARALARIVVIAFPQAVATCKEVVADLGSFEFHEVAGEDEALAIFAREIVGAAFLLTGTSAAATADATYWRGARAERVVSMAYLDQWSNIEKRFSSSDRDDWPDVLAVIDEHDRQMAEAIAPVGVAIRVTGSPAIARITAAVSKLRLGGVYADDDRLVFATEPVDDYIEYKRVNGFVDEDSFDLTIGLIRKYHPRALLVMRLHPRDSRERWIERLPRDLSIEWDSDERAECLARAGRVFGMRSFFLHEAWACHVKVYSVQPGRKTKCPLTDGRMPVILSQEDYSP